MSKGFNELVEPQIFSVVTFYFVKGECPNTVPELLKDIISRSGASPFVRWAKELRIENILPVGVEYHPWLDEERERMLASQKEDLVPAIKSLVRVESVEYVYYPRT